MNMSYFIKKTIKEIKEEFDVGTLQAKLIYENMQYKAAVSELLDTVYRNENVTSEFVQEMKEVLSRRR